MTLIGDDDICAVDDVTGRVLGVVDIEDRNGMA